MPDTSEAGRSTIPTECGEHRAECSVFQGDAQLELFPISVQTRAGTPWNEEDSRATPAPADLDASLLADERLATSVLGDAIQLAIATLRKQGVLSISQGDDLAMRMEDAVRCGVGAALVEGALPENVVSAVPRPYRTYLDREFSAWVMPLEDDRLLELAFALSREGRNVIGQVVTLTESEIAAYANGDRVLAAHVRVMLERIGLRLGARLPGWRPPVRRHVA